MKKIILLASLLLSGCIVAPYNHYRPQYNSYDHSYNHGYYPHHNHHNHY